MPFALWTRAAIRELIRREFGIGLSVRGVGEYLARWGYTPQTAARCTYERDDAALTHQDTVCFTIYPGGLRPQRLIIFMRRLMKEADRKVYLILDNLNVHKAKPVRKWLAKHAERIEVFYPPPCSPERNPTETFTGDQKGEIQRGIPPKDVKGLKRNVLGHSRRIQESPARVRAYFKNRHIRHAAKVHFSFGGSIAFARLNDSLRNASAFRGQ